MKQKQILVLSRQGYYSYVPVQGRTWREIIGSQPIQPFYAICEIKKVENNEPKMLLGIQSNVIIFHLKMFVLTVATMTYIYN